MGNISGVAVAIQMGGPGAVFWMWVSAIVGTATKYFTCTLAVMYRGRDSAGDVQGGPMYVIVHGLGPRWRPLAIFFCLVAMCGCLPVFNANQLTQAIADIALVPRGVENGVSAPIIGTALVLIVTLVITGGLKRIGVVVSSLVPFMVGVYFIAVLVILVRNFDALGEQLAMILRDAFEASYFDGDAVFGGALGGLIILGTRRAAFSNETGLGTAPMAHGAAKTSEPVHEGLVAMLGPIIDTLVVCTLTALAILVTGTWKGDAKGVSLTAEAFEAGLPIGGSSVLLVCILCFSLSSLFSYAYFGNKCLAFVFGTRLRWIYTTLYIVSILIGAISELELVIYFIDLMFALMAIPTVLSAVLLAPRVMEATREYASRVADRRSHSV